MLKKPGLLRSKEILHVVTPISNPARYSSRYRLFKQYQEHMLANPNVNLIVVETAFGDRQFEVTDAGNPNHIQLRTSEEIWLKENMINIGISRLPHDWKYVAWVDGDIQFLHPHWATETLHKLQHHAVVQLFETAVDLSQSGAVMQTHFGFGYLYRTGAPQVLISSAYSSGGSPVRRDQTYWHSGYAWGCTREAFDAMGGLLDTSIVGSGDHHMACAFIGQAARSVPKDMGESYRNKVMHFQERCEKYVRRNIGYVDGTIAHSFHGAKSKRGYVDRWRFLIDNDFDPEKHLHRDYQGLWCLNKDCTKIRDDLHRYHLSRDEDSNGE